MIVIGVDTIIETKSSPSASLRTRISSACSSKNAAGSVSRPSRIAALAIAVASIGSDFPGSRTARRDVSVSPGATRKLDRRWRAVLAPTTGHVPTVRNRPHPFAIELASEPDRVKRSIVARGDRQLSARRAGCRVERDKRVRSLVCVRLINRLRWHLVQIAPAAEAEIRPAGLIGPQIRARLARKLGRLPHSPQLRIATALLKRINEIYREELELLAELKTLIEARCPQLLAEHGCGTVTAAIIIGHTAGSQRFSSEAKFARHAGTAPIPASSGNTQRHRLHRGGNRQLNRAVHIIALSRARTDPATRAYLDRRHSEGKTKREAIRCLKRHLARRI